MDLGLEDESKSIETTFLRFVRGKTRRDRTRNWNQKAF